MFASVLIARNFATSINLEYSSNNKGTRVRFFAPRRLIVIPRTRIHNGRADRDDKAGHKAADAMVPGGAMRQRLDKHATGDKSADVVKSRRVVVSPAVGSSISDWREQKRPRR